MWVVRLSSILALVVALLLPPGLFRSCCCTRRAGSQTVVNHPVDAPPVRSCCQAKAAAAREAALHIAATSHNDSGQKSSGAQLQQQRCQCQSQLTNAAVLVSDQRILTCADELATTSPAYSAAISRVISTTGVTLPRSCHYLDPPLRKMLCRWMI